MRTYKIFSAENEHGEPVYMAIEDSELENSSPGDFFKPGENNIEEHGTIKVSGPAEHMLDSYFKCNM